LALFLPVAMQNHYQTVALVKITLIHNPEAGHKKQPGARELVRCLRRAGHEVTYQSIKNDAWTKVLDEPAELVAVAGGDGTVAKIARRLIGRSLPIAILPIGTANNISQTLGLADSRLEHWIRNWPGARTVNLDGVSARGPWGSTISIESAGAGFLASTMAKLDRRKGPRPAGHPQHQNEMNRVHTTFRQELEEYAPHHFEVVLDGRDLSGEYLLVEAMNIRHIGPGLHLAPDADPTDRWFDLVLVTKSDRKLLESYFSHRPGRLPKSRFAAHQGKRLRVKCQDVHAHVDDAVWPDEGSRPQGRLTINVSLDKQQVRFLALPRKKAGAKGGGKS
jgi:diacylglycerol kinase family enzyme